MFLKLVKNPTISIVGVCQKEYLLKINMNNGIEINGSLKCHSDGTMEDPFDRYDITITLW